MVFSLNLVILAVFAAGVVRSDNILFLQSTASKSHHIWHMQIIERLYDNGHNLTVLSFEEERSVPGKTFLVMSDLKERVFAEYQMEKLEFDAEQSPLMNVLFMYDYYEKMSRHLSEGEVVQRLLAYPKSFKFDLIIYEFTMGQFLLGYVDYFGNPPLVSVSAFNIPPHTAAVTDVPIKTSFMPHYASDFDSDMNIIERVKNILYWTVDHVFRNYIYMSNEERRAKKLFGPNAPSIRQVEKRSDIILVNADFSVDYYQLLAPNVISVAGLHVARPEQVPPTLEQFIARSNKGIILFSLGTNVQSEMFGPEINKQILQAFRSMPDYGFIWKHGVPEMLGEIPSNVLVLKWVPQSAILANPRAKLFISHGGLLGTQEATWYGVPVVGIPFMVDQYANIDKMVKAGVATKLLPKNLNGPNLKDAILRVVENPSFHEKMKERSMRFKKQPDHPLDRAIFWIEKVLENRGLPFLRSPLHDTSCVQMYNLDLLGVALLASILLYLLMGKVIALLIRKRIKAKKE